LGSWKAVLVQLTIRDFAIIRHLELILGPGLTTLSGETGAGKSIIISALNLILGARASAELIREGCLEAGVEALFHLPEDHPALEILRGFGIPCDGELVIRRIISREGRNRVTINGSTCTLAMLSKLGPRLVSISGQREHQYLLNMENHLQLLDAFGGLIPESQRFRDRFRRWQRLCEEISQREMGLKMEREREELARFQMEEIDRASLHLGEDTALEQERQRLEHSEELLGVIQKTYLVLYEQRDSLLSMLSQCRKDLEHVGHLDPAFSPLTSRLLELEAQIEDVAFTLRDMRKGIRRDPQRLAEVSERLELLRQIKRKYGPTLEEVLACRERLAGRVHDFSEEEQAIERLSTKRQELQEALIREAVALSKRRREAAARLETAVEEALGQLHMERTTFRVNLGPEPPMEGPSLKDLTEEGADRVEFLLSPNVGEGLRPLARIASGGELSRIMLALKSILARREAVETVVFDEVDAGISGATAQVVGEKLLELSHRHQLICITHLPQIASQGQTHFLVSKEVVRGRTQTTIRELDPKGRIQEIARLIGGRTITPAAMARAKEMLGSG